jgi:hypothetical protein
VEVAGLSPTFGRDDPEVGGPNNSAPLALACKRRIFISHRLANKFAASQNKNPLVRQGERGSIFVEVAGFEPASGQGMVTLSTRLSSHCFRDEQGCDAGQDHP